MKQILPSFLLSQGLLLLLGTAAQTQTLPLPARPGGALTGSQFAQQVAGLDLADRENELRSQILAGNVPDFLRKLCPVQLTNVCQGATNIATLFVAPDYLAVGSDADYLLAPMTPNTAQMIADALGCSLPTPRIVDAIYASANMQLPPAPLPPGPEMVTIEVFSNHNAIIRSQRQKHLAAHPLGALVAGHKKDVVLSARLATAPGKVAIYGWHRTNGVPIQPLYLGHTAAWVDYSQCVRLVQQSMLVNGTTQTVASLLADPDLAPLLSDEGRLPQVRYPTNSSNAFRPGFEPYRGLPEVHFTESRFFSERVASFRLEPDVKVHLNAPAAERSAATGSVLFVFYALPNGNTTEQTVGKRLAPGDDWHFDIQHIGAQTRFVRERLENRTLVMAYLENGLKSWPAWRKQHGDAQIPRILDEVESLFAGHNIEVVLAGHSGGGSLIFGYLNAVARIPDRVERIAFLDSNYAYDRILGHGEKLVAWLKASEGHFLRVLAYDDATALLEGKPFVTATGGTWGKSHEMQRDLSGYFQFTCLTNSDFESYSALDGRLQFLLKANPARKVLHTLQVERNGFIHALLGGTAHENEGYEYFGPRAYSQWITPE